MKHNTLKVLSAAVTFDVFSPHKTAGSQHPLHADLAQGSIFHSTLFISLHALQAKLVYADDLSHVWCQWAEMEVKHANYRRAIDLLKRATRPPPTANQRLTTEQLKARLCLLFPF
jgi:pre-mRNA-splicing factor SYF1